MFPARRRARSQRLRAWAARPNPRATRPSTTGRSAGRTPPPTTTPGNFAISTWQYSGSKIKIVADSALTSNDVEFKDGNLGTRASDPLGRYERHSSFGATDYIIFNKQKLAGASRDRRRYVALHELGHALGLCHKSDALVSLMWKTAPSPGYEITWIPDVDKTSYKKLWG
ncbi:matrixin family metalloprotease [Streptomyces sp. NPDC050600]|uniref:matrixin family metalloprotease n=1 Tax=Streptomyces sp. NPDC050600 TaxID=3157213 RepID=UPI00344402D7